MGSIFFLIGAIAHFFGLTIFPFYVHALYSPYHDSLIAMVSLFLTLLLLVIAHDPVKNRDTLLVIIIGVIMVTVFNFIVPSFIDFALLGAPEKKLQILVEGVMGIIYAVSLLFLYFSFF